MVVCKTEKELGKEAGVAEGKIETANNFTEAYAAILASEKVDARFGRGTLITMSLRRALRFADSSARTTMVATKAQEHLGFDQMPDINWEALTMAAYFAMKEKQANEIETYSLR